ncbi:phosphoglucosamine mutase [bacterium]|nr:phosphoglucosamine mutase [bacterium]
MTPRKYFGTDGIRGVANQDPMTTEVAMRVGRAAAYHFRREDGLHRVIIGKDTRRSSYMLEFAMAAGICAAGVDAFLVGPLPTPGIAFLTRDMRADAGVVISASHNPFQDNGIKFFDSHGFKLPDEVEHRIEDIMDAREAETHPATAADVGRAYRIDDAMGRYIVFLKKAFPAELTLEGMRIVLDCSNGAAYKVAPAVFLELGASLTIIGNRPNGLNINEDCGAQHPKAMADTVKAVSADIGIAFDGDADRVVIADETGAIVDGDHLMAATAKALLAQDRLSRRTLVTTVDSNKGLDVAMLEAGGQVVRTDVGDRYVIEAMQAGGFNYGGEKSGHMIFLDEHTTGDGVMSALQILATQLRSGRPASEFFHGAMRDFPQARKNIRVRAKPPLEEIAGLAKILDSARSELGERGRVLVRYSGTESLCRVIVEGEHAERIDAIAADIDACIGGAVGEA